MQVKFNPISATVGKRGYKVNSSTFKIKLKRKKTMKVKNLINYLESVNKNSDVCIQTKEGIFKIKVIEESVDADYNEIYLKNEQ